MPDEDLTEDRGIRGKQDALPRGGGGEKGEDVRRPRRRGEHDVGGVWPQERGRGKWDHGQAVQREAPRGAVAEEPDRGDAVPQGEWLGAGRSGDVRGEGGGGSRDVAGGLAEDGRQRRVCRVEGGEELSEEFRPVGTVQQRGGAVGGGGVPHAQHAEPQLR